MKIKNNKSLPKSNNQTPKSSKGITLVALVITIIILMILAGVTLNIVIDQNGIIAKAREGTSKWKQAQEHEQGVIEDYYGILDDIMSEEENLPIFVDSIEQFTDTSKKYVLPDGYLYEYKQEYTTTYTNQIPISKDANGNLVGLLENYRYNSSDTLVSTSGACATGFIPVKAGDTIRFKNIQFRNEEINLVTPGAIYIRFYNEDYTNLNSHSAYNILDNLRYLGDYTLDDDGNLESLMLNNVKEWAYMRMAFVPTTEDAIITVNEEISEPVAGEYTWQKTMQYIPAGWIEEIEETVATVNSIKENTDSNTIQFLLTSDIHYPGNRGMTRNIGKVSAEVMKRCDIPFFMNVGDSTTQSSDYNISDFQGQMDDVINNVLAPINNKKILLTVGNHDGATGKKEVDGETLYYRYQLNNEERANVFFGWQRANTNKKFAPDGTYYYIDDSSTKTRFIMLNSFWTQWDGDDDGFTTDIQHSFFNNPLFGQEQLNWFANVALNMPAGYSAIIGTHYTYDNTSAAAPLDTEIFEGIVNAYKNKTTYSGSYTGTQSWQSSSISVDYSSAKGELIAIFHGHIHKDSISTTRYAVPCIGITTAGADVRDENAPTRTEGTETETAIDIVTIDKTNRKIHITRLGVGNDRNVISY